MIHENAFAIVCFLFHGNLEGLGLWSLQDKRLMGMLTTLAMDYSYEEKNNMSNPPFSNFFAFLRLYIRMQERRCMYMYTHAYHFFYLHACHIIFPLF